MLEEPAFRTRIASWDLRIAAVRHGGNCHAEREEGAATSQVAEWEGASSKRPRDSIPRANLEMLTGYRPPADWHPAARITGSAS